MDGHTPEDRRTAPEDHFGGSAKADLQIRKVHIHTYSEVRKRESIWVPLFFCVFLQKSLPDLLL